MMAKQRGLLKQPDLNELQERLLMNVLIEEQNIQFKKEEEEFERELMIHRPDAWNRMQEEREEANEMGFDEVVWKSPESIEEFEEIERAIMGANFVPVEVDEQQMPTVATHFEGINLDELGEENLG